MRVVLFRGLVGAVFSTGMDQLAAKLKAEGHTTSVHSWVQRPGVQNRLAKEIAAGEHPDGVAAVGHSLGGNSANYFARNLVKQGVAVSYVATRDSVFSLLGQYFDDERLRLAFTSSVCSLSGRV